jgi:transmembrane sensor
MKPSEEREHDAAIEDAALQWLLERQEGFSARRAAEFAAWCAADPRHHAAVTEVEEGLAVLADLPAAQPHIARRLAEREASRAAVTAGVAWLRGFNAWAVGAAAAAIVVLVFAFGGFAWSSTGSRIVTDPTTVRRHVALADGSVLHVNTASDVQVQLTPRERRVTLHRGEAHFAVAPDHERPFVVTAAGLRVRAVGTAFDVRIDGAEVRVIVHEGRVEVSSEAQEGSAAPLLGAGEGVRSRDGRVQPVERLEITRLDAALAWHDATVTFSSLPLQQVVERFNRHNPLQLELGDASLASRPIGGTFSLRQPEALLHLLAQEGDVTVDRASAPGRVILKRK